MEGTPSPSATALPMVTPTIKPPTRPGPDVAATASITSRPLPASARGGLVEPRERDLRLGERVSDGGIEQRDMGAGGDFRHHAAIGRMQVELRAHHARK